MDRFRFYDISLTYHSLCNPTSLAKMETFIQLLDIPEGGSLLDIACGKGEFLIRTAEYYGCSATGVDLSPYAIEEARVKVADSSAASNIELIQSDGKEYDGPYASFHAVSCLGASWIWEGHVGTLRALGRWAKPGGYILVGEPYWKQDPDQEFLNAEGAKHDTFSSHRGNIEAGLTLGLTPVYAAVSNDDEWDHYETLQWYAAERWARDNPNDPDREEVIERAGKNRDTYLRWGRDTLGWALYLFRK